MCVALSKYPDILPCPAEGYSHLAFQNIVERHASRSSQVSELLGFADIVGKRPHGPWFFAVLCLCYLYNATHPQITARLWHISRAPRQDGLRSYKYGARCRRGTSILLTQIVVQSLYSLEKPMRLPYLSTSALLVLLSATSQTLAANYFHGITASNSAPNSGSYRCRTQAEVSRRSSSTSLLER